MILGTIFQDDGGKSLEDELSSLEGVKVSAPYGTEYRFLKFDSLVAMQNIRCFHLFCTVSTEIYSPPHPFL